MTNQAILAAARRSLISRGAPASHRQMPQFYSGEHHADDVVAYIKTIQTPPG
jgi:hypothetical protein